MQDPHSFARPQEACITHLELDLELDFEQKIIRGQVLLHIENRTATEVLVLDTQGLSIGAVFQEEEEVVPRLMPDVTPLGQALHIPIRPDTRRVKIFYETAPQAEALQWLEPHQTEGGQHPFLFTQSQAILARSWIPCQDGPGMRFTYSARIKVPPGLMALMSAENPARISPSGLYSFEMPQPIPAYLLALAVGRLEFAPISEQVGVYAEPNSLDAARQEFEEVPAMLMAAAQLYGSYAWGRYDLLVLPPSFPFGGMENPRITFTTPTIIAGDRSLTSLIAHELAHSWSGNLVTNATWNDFWLNEGFTVYFERRIMEALYGPEYAEMLAFLGYQDLQNTLAELLPHRSHDTHLKLALKGRNPDEGVNDIAYEKGFFLIKCLEAHVGRPALDEFLKQYFADHAFAAMDTEQFIRYLVQKLPAAVSLNLEEWIYQPGLPANCPVPQAKRFLAVQAQQTAWLNAEIDLKELQVKHWTSHEWLYWIRGLPPTLRPAQIESLDQAFGFTQSGNAEILCAWLTWALPQHYAPALEAVSQFLQKVGRRKFLRPLYRALLTHYPEQARAIYQKARSGYHFVSVHTLDKMLAWE
ncbi:MAG: M1 family metallopeptidase [Microscillaceae bacterium]|nr:M1 family metallopeptidase [Microscillaceae bacterium]